MRKAIIVAVHAQFQHVQNKRYHPDVDVKVNLPSKLTFRQFLSSQIKLIPVLRAIYHEFSSISYFLTRIHVQVFLISYIQALRALITLRGCPYEFYFAINKFLVEFT